MARLWYKDKIFLAYLAGFVDGEGTISLSKRTRGDNTSYVGYVSIPNSNYEVLDYIHKRLGFGSFRTKKINDNRFGKKPMFSLWFSQSNGRTLAEALLPYLIVKKEQAQIVSGLTVKWGYNTPEERLEKRLKNEAAYLALKTLHGRMIN